jgi:hypothetical protein
MKRIHRDYQLFDYGFDTIGTWVVDQPDLEVQKQLNYTMPKSNWPKI